MDFVFQIWLQIVFVLRGKYHLVLGLGVDSSSTKQNKGQYKFNLNHQLEIKLNLFKLLNKRRKLVYKRKNIWRRNIFEFRRIVKKRKSPNKRN